MSTDIEFKTDMAFDYGSPAGIAPGVVRVVAENPSPFTFKGTNTYVVGSTTLAVIDPGPDLASHREAILATAADRPVTHILITHAHRDHVDGASALAEATGARIAAYGRHRSPPPGSQVRPTGEAFIDYGFEPDLALDHGDEIEVGDSRLSVLFTPGHAPDHLCFQLSGSNILFSGDHIMAWNTTVIAPPEGNMADYMNSLELLLGRKAPFFLPGHGGRLEDPERMVKAHLVHRRWREDAILGAIRRKVSTIEKIVDLVYKGLDDRLKVAASLSVQAHVEHLREKGLVAADEPLNFETHLEAL